MSVIWITGASSGIGEALAKRYVKQQAQVILSSRRKPELDRVKQACIKLGAAEQDVVVLPLDVLETDVMAEKVQSALGA